MVDILSWADLCKIAEDVDKNFQFPAADGAVVPVNTHRWGAYAAGAAAVHQVGEPIDRLGVIRDNMLAARDYLDYAPNDRVYNDRAVTISTIFVS